MKVTNFVCVTLALAAIGYGVEGMDLKFTPPKGSEADEYCGVLTCTENNIPAGHTMSQLIIHSNTGRKSIKLSTKRPSIKKKYLGYIVDGTLEETRASLTLKMLKDEDCTAKYTCEIRTKDPNGKEKATKSDEQGKEGEPESTPKPKPEKPEKDDCEASEKIKASLEKFNQLIAALSGKVDVQIDTLKKAFSAVSEMNVNRFNLKFSEFEKKIASLFKASASGSQNSDAMLESLKKLMAENNKGNQASFDNVVKANEKVLEYSQRFKADVDSDFSNLNKKLDAKFKQLQDQVSSSSTEAVSGFCKAPCISDLISAIKSSQTTKPGTTDPAEPTKAPQPKFSTCSKEVAESSTSDVPDYYIVEPSGHRGVNFPYVCDSVTDGGGWIVIMRRAAGDVDFYRNWEDYKNGFGSFDGDFWLGNEKLYWLTKFTKQRLRIDIKFQGKSYYAVYGDFRINTELQKYHLYLGRYSGGTAGDYFFQHNGQPFSTFDHDNDRSHLNCAEFSHGGWWYHGACQTSNLTGIFKAKSSKQSARWGMLTKWDSVDYVEMKMRVYH